MNSFVDVVIILRLVSMRDNGSDLHELDCAQDWVTQDWVLGLLDDRKVFVIAWFVEQSIVRYAARF